MERNRSIGSLFIREKALAIGISQTSWKDMTVHASHPAREIAGKNAADIVSIFSSRSETPRRNVALIGSFSPRKCGIATFTTDIHQHLGNYHPQIEVDVWAMDSADAPLMYEGVRGTIAADRPEDYRIAARQINEDAVDVVWLQHEYGIFGGEDGGLILELVDRVAAPLVVTLHTVLAEPSHNQRRILEHLLRRASRVMVMSRRGRDLLIDRYGADPELVWVIAHGAPDRPFGRQEAFKARLGLAGRKVLMSFGLLGPGKGLETMIAALPTIVARHPEVVYRIVGATHPNLVASEGEAYRQKLQAMVADLGVDEHVLWEDRFLDNDELLDQLEACDIYVTPYWNLQQATSGTLSYAVALGKAVVSTPYLHARELLADGGGVLVEPGSSSALAEAVDRLLSDPAALAAAQRAAYAKGRLTIWPRFADATAALIESAVVPDAAVHPQLFATPGFTGVTAISDATGMLQHSIGIVPDRRHGYCLDDNARALMLVHVADGVARAERVRLATTYASFIQHAWNEDVRAFRNFMNFDRSWCEDVGSEDSNGRALWALGHAVAHAIDADLARWARRWFDKAIAGFDKIDSLRSVAFAMLGARDVLRADPGHQAAEALLQRGGDLLHRVLDSARRPDWSWFEAVLGYDNPRLPQALLEAGAALGREDWRAAGLESMEWIATQQISSSGYFRPIGSETFGRPYTQLPFDQQPLEAWAAVEAAASAYAATGDVKWLDHAETAYGWFFGANDRGVVLADLVTGRCRDGVTPKGANENCGAESILAFQLAHYALIALMRAASDRNGGTRAWTGSANLRRQACAFSKSD